MKIWQQELKVLRHVAGRIQQGHTIEGLAAVCNGDPSSDIRGDTAVIRNDEFCSKNEELCSKNDELCILNEEFAYKMMCFSGRVRSWRGSAVCG